MECESDMKWSSQPRTALELCAFLCCRPAEKLRLDALAERVSKLEQALAKGVRIAAAPAGDLPEPPPFDMPGDMDAPPFDMDAPEAAPKKAAVEKKPAAEKPKKAAIEGADKWEGVAAAIGAANAALMGPLSKVLFAGREGGTVILELAKNDNMFLKVLDNDKKKSMIAEKLSEAFGEPLGVAFRIAGSAGKPKGADPERTETIQQARDIFGRENVDFLD